MSNANLTDEQFLAALERIAAGTEQRGVQRDEHDGAHLLGDVEKFIRRFCVLPGEHCYIAASLWAAHTHFMDRFETTPRLACLSPEPGSGKTRVLEVLDLLCHGSLLALDLSMSAFFRIVEERQPTILLDEVDAIFHGKEKSESTEDMRRIINNGYRIGAVVQRVGGKNRDEVQEFHVFTPVAMAGLGRLPDTLMSRSVIIRMKRRGPGERVEPFRDRLHRPEGEQLRDRLADWSNALGDLGYPDLPDGVVDRDADVWEPLITIADAAGGDWPARARKACLEFLAEKPESSVSLGVRLLTDIRTIWPESRSVMATSEIITELSGLDEAPWADLYGEGLKPRKLAQLLGDYDIHSHKVRVGESSVRGYRREDMWDAWNRYAPAPTSHQNPEQAEQPEQASNHGASDVPNPASVPERTGQVPEHGEQPELYDPQNPGPVPHVPDVPDSPETHAGICAYPPCGVPLGTNYTGAGLTMHNLCAARAQKETRSA